MSRLGTGLHGTLQVCAAHYKYTIMCITAGLGVRDQPQPAAGPPGLGRGRIAPQALQVELSQAANTHSILQLRCWRGGGAAGPHTGPRHPAAAATGTAAWPSPAGLTTLCHRIEAVLLHMMYKVDSSIEPVQTISLTSNGCEFYLVRGLAGGETGLDQVILDCFTLEPETRAVIITQVSLKPQSTIRCQFQSL